MHHLSWARLGKTCIPEDFPVDGSTSDETGMELLEESV